MARLKSLHLVVIIILVKVNLNSYFNCGQKNGRKIKRRGKKKANKERKA